MRLLMLTGCRHSEFQTLRWEHVDLDAGELHLPDSKSGARIVPLAQSAVGRPHRLASRSRESVGHRRQEARITSDGSQSPVVADSGACRYRSPDRTAFVTPGGMQVRPDATINLHAPARVDPSSGNLLEIQPNPARRPREIRLVLDPYPSAGCSSVRGITVTQTNSPARAAARHASRGRFA